jgi:hypothetical protein
MPTIATPPLAPRFFNKRKHPIAGVSVDAQIRHERILAVLEPAAPSADQFQNDGRGVHDSAQCRWRVSAGDGAFVHGA